MPPEAQAVHGLSSEFLRKHKTFGEVVADFIEFIEDSPLVIHNADFDMRFLNWELKKLGFAELPMQRAIDTVKMARRKFPGAPASLDALCKRFMIDNSGRDLHGALIDADLLAQVYLELVGGRQAGLDLAALPGGGADSGGGLVQRVFRPARTAALPAEEEKAHQDMITKIKDAIWGANS
jgi:DNA polymerase-3 subunit epsilon